jgi:hypothetical protein
MKILKKRREAGRLAGLKKIGRSRKANVNESDQVNQCEPMVQITNKRTCKCK